MPEPVVSPAGHSHVSIRVRDLARSRAWYERVLGYCIVREGPAPTPDRTPHMIGLIGTAAVELLAAPEAALNNDALGPVGLSLTVPDADVALARLQAAGIATLTPVIAAAGWRIVFLSDPDGNIVELVQQPEGASDMGAWASTQTPSPGRRGAQQGE